MYVTSTATNRMLVIIIFFGVGTSRLENNKTRTTPANYDLLTLNVHNVN